MKVLGIVGNLGVGKDTIAEIMRQDHGFVVASLADELKRLTGAIFDVPSDVMFGESRLRATRDERVLTKTYWVDCAMRAQAIHERVGGLFPGRVRYLALPALLDEIGHFASNRELCTARYLLQRMGTEWGRSLYMDVWVDALGRTIANLRTGKFGYSRENGLYAIPPTTSRFRDGLDGVVITDVRFENEIAAVHGWGGVAMWVDASKRVPPSGDKHKSEPTYADFAHLLNGVIDNNGNVQQLSDALNELARNMTGGARS